jgi:PTS system galactitol-specific IIA component
MKLLNEDLIHLDVDVNTSEEAIKFMAEILEKNGYVQKEYCEKVIDREKVFPTGLQGKTLGLAIPHTDPEFAIKPAVCMIVPKKPVVFGQMAGTPDQTINAEVIMPLVISDGKTQVDILRKLTYLLEDGEKLKCIRDSKSKKEIIEILSYLEED